MQSKKVDKDQETIQSSTTQDTTWERNKNTINITNKSQEVSRFPADDQKAAMNRRESMRSTRHKNTNDPQKKYRLGTVSKNILLEGLNRVSRRQPHSYFRSGSRHIDVLVCMKDP